MSDKIGVAWYDALPGLSPCDSPSGDSARAFWSSQIARAREAIRNGHGASRRALARTLLAGYYRGLGPECLSESLTLFRDLHKHASNDDLVQATLDLGEALFEEHRRTGTIDSIQEMIQIDEQSSNNEISGPDIRCQLAKSLIARGVFTGQETDMTRARSIIDATAVLPGEPSRPELAVVSAMHHVALWRASRKYTLQELRPLASELLGHLKHLDGSSHERRSDLLAAYFSVCDIICHMTDECGSDAAEVADDTLAALSEQTLAVVSALSSFCLALALKHKNGTQYVPKSRQLIEVMFHAAKGNRVDTSEAHHALGRWLNFSFRWCKNGRVNTLDIAAAHYREALASCPVGHMHHNAYLVGLSFSLHAQYGETGARSALEQIIALCDSHGDIVHRIPPLAVNVAEALIQRAQAGRLRLSSKRALTQRATQIVKDALLATLTDTGYGSILFSQLTTIYLLETSWGCSTNSDEHLAIARREVTRTLHHSTDRSTRAGYNLAHILLSIARQNKDVAAIHEGMDLLEQLSTRTGFYNDATRLHNVCWLRANGYMIRYKLLGVEEDRQTAEATFQMLRNDRSATWPRSDELLNIFSWADVAHHAGQDVMELCAYQEVVGRLPQFAYIGEDVATRVEALQLAEGLAGRAAVSSISCGNLPGAVELLEQSRGVVWAQTLRSRMSLSSVPPDYAEDFARITSALKQASGDSPDNTTKRRDSAAQLDSLLDCIRQVKGYERFLLPRLYTELRTCTFHGFVVLAIPSDICTDVLIMRSGEDTPRHLRLPSVQLQRLQDWTAQLKRSCDQSRASMSAERLGVKISAPPVPPPRERAYLKVLGELWREIVQPVLANLGVERSQDDLGSRPRLWWCPTGPFAELPLHAAGIYRGNDQDCLSDYVVSSYTPTLSALINAQSASSKDGGGSNVLVVAAPHNSEGLPSLPNTRAEADRIRDVIPSASLTTLSGLQACIEDVLTALPNISVLHLACHGQQSQNDTLSSGFSLRDGRLTLKRLMQLHLPNAELAYLSACETASTDEYQPDEAMNLAATMLFVGFKSVVATMWSMDDLDGPFIAERVYQTIFRDSKLNLSAVPHALDAAVRDLRETGAHPSRWATYVHIGA